MAGNTYTSEMRMDISNLKKSMQEARRQISMARSEFKAASAGMDDWGSSTEGLSAKLEEVNKVAAAEKSKLADLKKQYEIVAKAEGENSAAAQNLSIKINYQTANVKKAETEFSKFSTKLQELEREQDAAAQSAQVHTGKLEELQKEITIQEKALQNLKRGYASAALELGENSDQAKDLAGQIRKMSGELSENRKKLSDAAGAADNLDASLKETEKAAKDAGDGFTTMKGVIANLIADGIKALAKEAVDSLKEIVGATDEAYNNFRAKTGASAAEMKGFEKQIDELYKSGFGDSMNDVASAMAEVKQQTKETDPTALKEMTENAIALRDTFGYDVKEQLRAVNMLMDQFGISSEEAFNLITQGAQNGLDKNGDLLDTINEYGVHYKQLGYSADDFFNSLASGTDAGTFSVDKLGDSVKEFGIKAKDTSKTSQEGFELLGYSAGTSKEEIDKTKVKIGELEKKLKYAKMEQEGFNKKTSDLTKIKNADKIKEYSSELEQAKNKLKNMKSEGEKTKGSINELQKSFAEGGEKAQEATKEVMDKLLKMKDKVKQNQAGVALFGTMWEDLGVEGVKALMKTNGSMKKTKKSMEEIKKVKYDDVKSRFKELGRTVQMDLLLPMAEKLLPKIEGFATKAIDHMDEIIASVKVGGAILGTAFAAKKIVDVVSAISGMVTAFRTAKTAIEGATAAQKILNIAQAASPIGLLIAGVGALVGTLITFNATADEAEEKYAGLTEEQKKNIDSIKEMNEAHIESVKAREEGIQGVQSEFSHYENLKEELDDLVDKNGKVKEGEEDRVKFIITKLNEALGTELTLNGDIVENYKEQKKTLDELIKKKEAQAVLAKVEGDYGEALAKNEQLLNNLTEAEKSYENITKQVNDAKEKKKKLEEQGMDGWAEEKGIRGSKAAYQEYLNELIKANKEVEKLEKSQEELGSTVRGAENAWADNNATIQNYEKLSEALMSGNDKKIKKAMQNMTHNLKTAKTGNKRILQEQVDTAKRSLENVREAIKKGTPGVGKEAEKMAEQFLKRAEKELSKCEETGKNAVEGLEQGMKDPEALGGLEAAGQAAAMAALTAMNKTLEIHSPSRKARKSGVFFTQGFALGITDRIRDVGKAVAYIAKKAWKELLAANKTGGYEKAGTRIIESFEKGIEKEGAAVEKAVEKLVDQAVSQAKKQAKGKKNKEAFEKLGESMIKSFSDSYEKAADKAVEKVRNKIESLTKSTQEKYDAIKALQDDMESRLSSGELYKEEDGVVSLTDFGSETERIRKLGNNLEILKKKLSAELMTQIADLNTEEGLKLTEKLLSISDVELKQYNETYAQKLKASSQVASRYYENQIKSLQEKYTDKAKKVMKSLEKQLEKIGKNAMEGFIKGFGSKDNELTKAVKGITSSLVKQMRKELKIHSPSGVMRDMVGRFIPDGIAEGIRRNADRVQKAMKHLQDDIVTPMKKAASGIHLNADIPTQTKNTSQIVNNYNNFSQTNNSPKPLSRWDVYRQSRNLLEGITHV